MILLDTNIVIDLLSTQSTADMEWSRRAYARALTVDTIACTHVVLAEVAAGAARPKDLPFDFKALQIEILGLSDEAAIAAGRAFAAYRQRGGHREAILADFLVGGHAHALAAPLMTRDRRLGSYFPDLTLITPESHP